MDANYGAAALKALEDDRSIQLVAPNYHSTAEDPWWLLDVKLNNEQYLSTIPALQPRDYPFHQEARLRVLSPFEPEHLSPMSKTAPAFFVPGTFESIAMKIVGNWSPVLLLHESTAEAAPDIPDNVTTFNIYTPYWDDIWDYEYGEVEVDTEAGPSAQLKRRRMSISEPGAKRRIRRIRTFYDHAVIEDLRRIELFANFSIFNVGV
jgi:hypothetical protein